MVQAIAPDFCKRVPISEEVVTALSPDQANQMDNVLSPIVQKYGDKILLTESDRKPKISRKKERKSSGRIANKQRPTEGDGEWQGPPPWDVTSGGDGSPKFLCDVMVRYHILATDISIWEAKLWHFCFFFWLLLERCGNLSG